MPVLERSMTPRTILPLQMLEMHSHHCPAPRHPSQKRTGDRAARRPRGRARPVRPVTSAIPFVGLPRAGDLACVACMTTCRSDAATRGAVGKGVGPPRASPKRVKCSLKGNAKRLGIQCARVIAPTLRWQARGRGGAYRCSPLAQIWNLASRALVALVRHRDLNACAGRTLRTS